MFQIRIAGLLLLVLMAGSQVCAQTIPNAEALNEPCKKYCGYDGADSCSNKPFEPTECKTTPCGPARANVVFGASALQSTNMLYCPGGTADKPQPYALCFFSGPTTPTGNPPPNGPPNNTLTCTPDYELGVANCQCQVYNQGAYYVDINSILNQGAFWETHKACGKDGSLCKNLAACDANGHQKTDCGPGQTCPKCPVKIAPVCDYVAAQPFDKDKALYPKSPHAPESRVDLISTFSFAMGTTTPGAGPYTLGSVSCDEGVYAGCMTAPCAYVGDKSAGSIVNCACPMWKGKYQIGQPPGDVPMLPSGNKCPADAGWVWSAANNVGSAADCK